MFAKLKAEFNPIVFIIGLSLLAYGLWLVHPCWSFIGSGAILMLFVVADSAVKIGLNLRERK